jgi:hypothetical protein
LICKIQFNFIKQKRGDEFLVSRLHIEDMNIGVFGVYVSTNLTGPYIQSKMIFILVLKILVEKHVHIPHGKQRVLKIGSLPCRYLKIVMQQGAPFLDYSK